VLAKLASLGFDTIDNTSEELSSRIQAEIPKWAKVIEMAGIKAEQGTANSRSGAPETIRTSDLCLRRATLYPAELRARVGPQ
jgi:hypothetical protein